MKIRGKIFLLIFTTSLLILSLVIAYIVNDYRKYSLEDANKQVINYTSNAADLIQTSLEKDLSVCHTIAQSFQEYEYMPPTLRDSAWKNTLKTVLEFHHEYLSTWMTWELRFINKKYKQEYGRRRTASFKENGLTKFYIDTVELKGDNLYSEYYEAKQSHNDILTNPYYSVYSVGGDSILETSIATPIMIHDEFAGLIGIDMTLERFSLLIQDLGLLDMGKMFLISNEGFIISNSFDNSLTHDTITSIFPSLIKHDVKNKIQTGKTFSLRFVDKTSTTYFAAFAPIKLGNAKNSWSVCLMAPTTVIEKAAKEYFIDSIIVGFIGIIILSLISIIVASRMAIPVKKATRVLTNVSKGEIDLSQKMKANSKDELGEMNRAINTLVERLKETADFAKQIGEGNFSVKHKILSEKDTLGRALLDMQKNLKIGKEQEEIRQAERKKLSWTQEGLTELSEVLRKGNDDFEEYLLSILRYIIKFIKAEQGAIFLLNRIDEDHPFLELRSAYAYNKKKALEAHVEIGESLVGRCFQEEETIYMTNIPEGYTFVSSGLGEHQPKCLFMMPLIFEHEVFGVVEIASFREFEDYEIDFLKVIGERIASSISVMEKSFQTQKVLERYKSKSAELENIEQALAENKKTLIESQNFAANKELENVGIRDAVSNIASITWFDMEGKILSVQDKHLAAIGYSQEDIIKQKELSISSIKEKMPADFSALWRNLKEGKEGKIENYYTLNKEQIKIIEIYRPIKDEKGEYKRVLNVSLDSAKLI